MIKNCPKCSYQRHQNDVECPRCGIIYNKYETHIETKQSIEEEIKKIAKTEAKKRQRKEFQGKLIDIITEHKKHFYIASLVTMTIVISLIVFSQNSKHVTKPAHDKATHAREKSDDRKISDEVIFKNNIERACNATIAIKTPLGSGSGFFIDGNGHILTNKHVIRGDDIIERMQSSLDRDSTILSNATDYLREVETWLSQEAELVLQMANRLETLEMKINRYRYSDTDYALALISQYNNILSQYKYKKSEYEKKWHYYKALSKEYNIEKSGYSERVNKYDELQSSIFFLKYLNIKLPDSTEHTAQIIAVSDRYDLALLKIDKHEVSFIESAIVNEIARGETLYAIGNPVGIGQTVTSGIFSGRRENFIQTNAQINPGSSGGPLITKDGKVIGIITLKIVGEKIEGLGFAIPIDIALKEFENHLK